MAGAEAAPIPEARADLEKGSGRDWPQRQPTTSKRPTLYFAGPACNNCCPPYLFLAILVGLIAFVFGLVAAVVVLALALVVVVLLGWPLCTLHLWGRLWACWPWYWNVDVYTKLVFMITQSSVLSWKQPSTTPSDFPVDKIQPKRTLRKYALEFALNIDVPVESEEDFGAGSRTAPIAMRLENLFAKALPMTDRFETFEDGEDPVQYVMNQFKNIYPPIYQEWNDKTSDDALTRYCFYGLGAHRVDSVMEDGVRRFVVRADALSTLPVRDGFARYGGDAYFDETWRPLKIVDSGWAPLRSDGPAVPVTTRPGEAGWEEAKFRFRSSLAVLVTLVDHLYQTHLQTSNIVVTAAREQLSAEHPLRRFLLPFSYRTIWVNDDAHNNLIAPKAIAPRVFAFTDRGYRSAFAVAPKLMMSGHEVPEEEGGPFLNRTKYVEYLKEKKGIDTEFHRQSAKYFDVIRQFVADYLRAYYPDAAAAVQDAELMAFVRQVAFQLDYIEPVREKMRICACLEADAYSTIIDILADFIFVGTAMHEQAGAVEPYVQDCSFAAGKWVPGKLVGTKQTASMQALLITLTATPMPKLYGGDWTFLFPSVQPPPGAKTPKQAFDDFQAGLRRLSEEADAYNAAAPLRNFPENFPMYVLNPKLLDTSPSV